MIWGGRLTHPVDETVDTVFSGHVGWKKKVFSKEQVVVASQTRWVV